MEWDLGLKAVVFLVIMSLGFGSSLKVSREGQPQVGCG